MDDKIYPPCKKCGADHKMGLENMETGEIAPIDYCNRCLFKGTTFRPKTEAQELESERVFAEIARLRELKNRVNGL